MVLEQFNIIFLKILPQLSTNMNSRYTIDLNVKVKTLKLLKENTGKNLYDLEVGKDFVGGT